MTSNRLIGIGFAVLVAFSVACALYVYVQQKQLEHAAQSSALYQAEKQKLLDKLRTDKSFAERLVDESLQHQKKVEALEIKLVQNERALKLARARAQAEDSTEPLESPELAPLRERVGLLEEQKSEQQKENDSLRLAVKTQAESLGNYETVSNMQEMHIATLQHELRKQKRVDRALKVLLPVAAGLLGYGLGHL